MDMTRNVYEGWTPADFINELQPICDMIMNGASWQQPFQNKAQLKTWLITNQPYYKKNIPEVLAYFAKRYKLK